MGEIAYITNIGLGSAPLAEERIVIAKVPGTGRITAPYANQAAGYSVLMCPVPTSSLVRTVRRELEFREKNENPEINLSPRDIVDLETRIGSVIDGLWLFLKVDGHAEVKRKDGITGAVRVLNYGRTSEIDLPEQLMHKYLPMQRLIQYVTVLEQTLKEISFQYLTNITSSDFIDPALVSKLPENFTVHPGVVLRSVLPQNEAVGRLYPDSRVFLESNPELNAKVSAAAAKHYRSGLIAKIAAPRFNLSEGEAAQGIQTLTALLDGLMPLLPFDVYDLIMQNHAVESLMERMRAIKREVGSMGPVESMPRQVRQRHSLLISQYQRLAEQQERAYAKNKKLMQRMNTVFAIEPETMNGYDAETVEEVIKLLGEKVSFIRKVLQEDLKQKLVPQGVSS
ncbi:hypothetical protein HYY73_05380 [Candidatus Woesearchaeota archaeon]|nr:hypothetical protein [Candidatus Woesearchaeota archaeon]